MPNGRLTILHINTEKTYRGGEVQTMLLARELQSRGHQNVIIAQRHSPLSEKAKEARLPSVELSMKGEWDLFAAHAIRKAILSYQPDILHAHTSHACSLALLAQWRRKVPVVFSRRINSPIPRNFKYRQVNAFLAVSSSIRNLLVTYFPAEKVFVAESGTDFSALEQGPPAREARALLGIGEKAFVIGNVNQFDWHKGQIELLRAFLEFARQKTESCYLLLVGDGPLFSKCRAAAQKSPLGERILFTGRRWDLRNIYPALDVFFFCSMPAAHEGWPGSLREAMGMGIASVAVRQPATEEFIVHGEAGLLVSPHSQKEWIQEMDRLLTSPQLRSALAECGKKFARQFTPQNLADKTIECYRAVLEKEEEEEEKD